MVNSHETDNYHVWPDQLVHILLVLNPSIVIMWIQFRLLNLMMMSKSKALQSSLLYPDKVVFTIWKVVSRQLTPVILLLHFAIHLINLSLKFNPKASKKFCAIKTSSREYCEYVHLFSSVFTLLPHIFVIFVSSDWRHWLVFRTLSKERVVNVCRSVFHLCATYTYVDGTYQ